MSDTTNALRTYMDHVGSVEGIDFVLQAGQETISYCGPERDLKAACILAALSWEGWQQYAIEHGVALDPKAARLIEAGEAFLHGEPSFVGGGV